MRNYIFVLLIALFFGGLFSTALAQSYENSEAGDLRALVDLYKATDGDNWYNTRDGVKPWDVSATSLPGDTDWFGVTTKIIDDERRVVHLDLQRGTHIKPADGSDPSESGAILGNNLEGELPSSFRNLTKVRYVNLKQNKLTGEIPQNISHWTEIERLLLTGHTREPQLGSYNHPVGGGALPHKSTYATNSFTGSLPDLTNWTKLEVIECQQNASSGNPNASTGLTGELPKEFGSLPNLKMIMLNHNSLTGSLPAEWANASELFYINISSNNLSGTLPPEWGQLSKVQHLRMHTNELLEGEVPAEWSGLVGLDEGSIFFSYTGISGAFPAHILELGVYYFEIKSANFSGELPDNVDMSKVKAFTFNIHSNEFHGAIPNWVTQMRVIQLGMGWNNFGKDANGNLLSEAEGKLPKGFHDSNSPIYERLRLIRIVVNSIPGPLPQANLGPDILTAEFSGNRFSGSIPVEWGDITSDRDLKINVKDNNLSGAIPVEVADISFTSGSSFKELNISDNKFSENDISAFRTTLLNNHPGIDFIDSNQNPKDSSSSDDGGGDDTLSAPNPVAPANESGNVSATPTFEWEDTGADHYILHVSSSNPTEMVIDITHTDTKYTPEKELRAGTEHHWRVRGVKDGVEGEWSPITAFTTVDESDDDGDGRDEDVDFVPLTPENNQHNVELKPEFTWETVQGAEQYRIELRKAETTEEIVTDMVSSPEYAMMVDLAPNTDYKWRVQVVFSDGTKSNWSDNWMFKTGDSNEAIYKIEVRQNYPNPFNPTTNIQFSVSETQDVSLKVYDMAGRLVATLFDGAAQGGALLNVPFSAESLASGVYFYRLITDTEIVTRKMTLMK